MKETMSNIDIRLILPELKEAADGAFVKNVYQYGDVFVLKLYQPAGGTSQLLFEVGRRIHLTEYRRVAPRIPPKFCTALRKYLRDRRVLSVYQHDLDRIVVIEVGDESSSHKLVVELFGNGNVLLLDPEDTIFVAMRYRRMKDRDVIPKAKYEFPPPRGIDVMNLEADALEGVLSESKASVVRTLASRLNLDSQSCEEICALGGVDPQVKVPDLDEQAVKDLSDGLSRFIEKLKNGISEPRVVIDDDDEEEHVAFVPFIFEVYNGQPTTSFSTFSQAIDSFFGISDMELEDEEILEAHDKERKRLERIIEKQKEGITRLETKAANLRLAGEAIYNHFQMVQEVLETISSARVGGLSWAEITSRVEDGKEKGMPSAVIIERIIPSQGKILVRLADVDVSLDIRKSAQDNASLAYEQAKKSEAKTKGAQKQIDKTMTKLKELEVKAVKPEAKVKVPVRIRKKRWYEKFRWFLSSEGLLVIGGRDAKTNERLAKRQMESNDVFLHAALHGAPYTIVKVSGDPPGEQTLTEAAQFAVTFSRAWQDGLSSGDAYWVNPEQVSFTPPSGEYLPSGAVMIYGSKNYIRRVPLELAVGVMFEDSAAIPVSGPPSALSAHTDYTVRVIPSKGKKGQLVKEILNQLKKLVPENNRDLIDQIPQEDMMRVLPAGGGELVSRDSIR
ncbi:MAG: ribosome rescue protein RqcH [Candidatus Thorarchaeota archaeon]|jgi:predicted ribosome quality control (RQC) complex YloA/Tae2 family protein